MNTVTRIVLLGVVCALAALCDLFPGCSAVRGVQATAHGAPAPLVKTTVNKRSDVIGEWVIRWGSCDYPIHLYEDGTYKCMFSGIVYNGVWTLRHGKIYVMEWAGSSGDYASCWNVRPSNIESRTPTYVLVSIRRP